MLEKIAEVENLEVPAEEIEAEYKTMAETYNMEIEKVKDSLPAEMLERDLKLRKAADLIVANAVAVEKKESAEAEAEANTEAPAKKPAAKKPAAKKSAKKEEEPTAAEE